MKRVTILGSLNIDTTLKIEHFPLPGETVEAISKSSTAGGKGANQAVAAARLGAKTYFIGCVGQDSSGKYLTAALAEEGIDTANILRDSKAGTGTANILLDKSGQNSIVIYGGANRRITAAQIQAAVNQLAASEFLVAQFETSLEMTLKAFTIAHQQGVKTILNPAPAHKIAPELLQVTDLIVPNEIESCLITGIKITDQDSMEKTAQKFREMGIANLIITLGSRGVYYAIGDKSELVPAFKVRAVDTTAAGDTFIGALAAKLDSDFSNMAAAIKFAQKASSITVQRLGAQAAIPTLTEVEED
ncbi:MAG: ribokinase [Liquorilactobacillus ghanensis]|uniref:ribokinase n=1 Tax=Liquorilactobacillus ghanensis TaxID=399370 RepID=UPI0039EA0414